MDDPVKEITGVIETLCTASPSSQQQALEKYFAQNAAFTHPFCRTGSSKNSRWWVGRIYLWYKILSPNIDVHIDSIDLPDLGGPFYKAQPSLVTVLKLTHDDGQVTTDKTEAEAEEEKTHADGPDGQAEPSNSSKSKRVARKQRGSDDRGKKYYILSQNDLYQTTEFIKFIVPFGIGVTLMKAWQLWATFMCVLGAFLCQPIIWMEENGRLRGVKRGVKKE